MCETVHTKRQKDPFFLFFFVFFFLQTQTPTQQQRQHRMRATASKAAGRAREHAVPRSRAGRERAGYVLLTVVAALMAYTSFAAAALSTAHANTAVPKPEATNAARAAGLPPVASRRLANSRRPAYSRRLVAKYHKLTSGTCASKGYRDILTERQEH